VSTFVVFAFFADEIFPAKRQKKFAGKKGKFALPS